ETARPQKGVPAAHRAVPLGRARTRGGGRFPERQFRDRVPAEGSAAAAGRQGGAARAKETRPAREGRQGRQL
ncbi:MAG: hypothetical protein AVDCRST_MAG23-2028, partial [uncultured Sphingosinicella sp.]